MVALAEDQGQDEFARFLDLGGVGLDDHVVAGRQRAGRLQGAGAFDLDQAQAAAAVGCQFLVVAQGRDVDPGRRAASRTVVPSGTSICFPSIVRLIILYSVIPRSDR